jgi:hypothetical protein
MISFHAQQSTSQPTQQLRFSCSSTSSSPSNDACALAITAILYQQPVQHQSRLGCAFLHHPCIQSWLTVLLSASTQHTPVSIPPDHIPAHAAAILPTEIFNGRLAMLGLFAAIGAELATGESALTQFQSATPAVLATWAIFSVASLIPLLKGADPTAAFGPFTRAAELANGRAAMIGVAGLLIVELTKGSALF